MSSIINTIRSFFSSNSSTSITTTASTATVEEIISEFDLMEVQQEDAIASFTPDLVTANGTLCTLAYSDLSINREATPAHVELALFETALSTVFARANGLHVTLAYKGTSSFTDLATDFNALPSFDHALFPELKGLGYIHKGFLDAFASTWTEVEAFLEAHAAMQGLKLADLNVTLTGHSLGAAQATLASLRLAHLVASPSTQLRQVTFGSPRGLSTAIAARLSELMGPRILRVAENDVDIVTMVAPGFLGFKHVGLNLVVCKPSGMLPHVMEGYMAGVAALDLNTFVPTFALGMRRSFLFALRRLLSLRSAA